MKAAKVTPFSGRCEDFEDFEREWTMYLRMLTETEGHIGSTPALYLLKERLDAASATWLTQLMHENPNLDYWVFWKELKARHQKDLPTIHK